MPKFDLVLLIHAHQPLGNFDDVMERTYLHSYLPFVECLARHPQVRMGLHYSGPLLEWFVERHPEYLERLRALTARGQVEMVGGGFYEPILISIPPEDQQQQIRRLADFIAEHFGMRPGGAWLAERVWEPQLPSALAEAEVEYTLVDDSHFLSAGRELHELYGYFITEDCGRTVKVIPGLQELRYLLPFGTVDASIDFLRRGAQAHPGGFAAMGDDMEKFGGWPHTWEHCYAKGWLENFFAALEANQEWLRVVPPREALAARPPRGRADLPTASYTEMMEWVLPTPARERFHAIQQEFGSRPDVRRFLRGGFWRGFFSKYPESNLLHKKMLRVAAKLRPVRTAKSNETSSAKRPPRRAYSKAVTHLLRGQCNDAYWHGIFGGLYAPHLRTSLWRELIQAEVLADAGLYGAENYSSEQLDYDADGTEEIEITSPQFAALIKPAAGGTLPFLDFRPRAVTLINSLQRRPETYHALVRDAAAHEGSHLASIHDQVRSKELGLDRFLRYDRWPRHSFRLLLFSPEKTHGDYEAIHLDESAAFAGGDYVLRGAGENYAALLLEAPLTGFGPLGDGHNPLLRAVKTITLTSAEEKCQVQCQLELSGVRGPGHAADSAAPWKFAAGLEIILNLLAPNQADRYFEFSGARQPLSWSGVVNGQCLRAVDEWQDVAVEVQAPGAKALWIAPIETVSESEEGFERVYQGSQILALWNVELAHNEPWRGDATLRITPARNPSA